MSGYPLSTPGAGLVVDVDGSHGDARIAITRKFPVSSFVVQDPRSFIASCELEREMKADFRAYDFSRRSMLVARRCTC